MSRAPHADAESFPGAKRLVRLAWLPTIAAALLVGCASPAKPWQAAGAEKLPQSDNGAWSKLAGASGDGSQGKRWSGSVTAVASVRPTLPNGALQLPRVSPDGRWIAFVDQPTEGPGVKPDALISGRGLDPVSLWVRGVEAQGLAKAVALQGAAWASWSEDGSTLTFISHDDELGCTLGLHDVASGQTLRKAVGLRHMLMPAMQPGGRRVAVSAYGEIADRATLFLIDLDTDRATPGPPPHQGLAQSGAQVFPRWLDDDTLLYVELSASGGTLMRWSIDQPEAQAVAPLPLPPSIFDAQHTLAGIAQPLSPSRQYFAYYDVRRDGINLVDLRTGDQLLLPGGHRSGAWWGDDWFIAADNERVQLFSLTQGGTDDELRPLHLLPGRWAPLWADPVQRSILLVGQATDPADFSLLQLWVVAEHER